MSDKDDFYSGLETEGEEAIRRRLTNGGFGQVDSQLRSSVELWLAWKESSRREAAANSFAREANSIAREANDSTSRRARRAEIIAIIAAIIAAVSMIRDVIISLLK